MNIFVEQIKAAREGRNYWTGEEISKWQLQQKMLTVDFATHKRIKIQDKNSKI
ncbi:hypothetical protein [Paenibacillus polymyxa]|uniref:hypothetical protein n=1 Tax=Paenibacillus polymyxa TaxID=1406 RepID=UPI00234AB8B1|nr:hypothetical protein [Paenibacillus polymyxa]WCM60003.1 hypothetical protein OYT09_18625 [Paenibacillus polymyxa]